MIRSRPSKTTTTLAIRRWWLRVELERVSCSFGQGRSWYRAVLTNSGGDAYPLCSARAFDSRGNIVFSGQHVFDFGGWPAGLQAQGHRSDSFSWYLPDVSRPVVRYLATCSVDNNPPI